ncbi:uncharacterized protein [Spinacia oleracea]|uniref:Reverse transcriptase domain-containing protein n=1 Tax=Spinacia oleracea TaxID=3562 RepID=A0A9R0JVD9_SPIOL|nr:uncharacterized protein LOC110787647 [Spinacia oleracea]
MISARRKFYAVVKLDMNKAYDRVRWEFLFQALQAFGFPPYWINIIRLCVTTVSYQVLVNGEPTRAFQPLCGLRQGDPLSPYLFVLCMEVFSSILHRAERMHLIEGISISRGAPSISHLFFADDSLLFFRMSPEICDQVLALLSEFSSISGQVINYQKSFVNFSPNTPQDYCDFLAASLRLGQRSSLGPYLGVPVDMGRSKCDAFYGLVDCIARRIANFASLRMSSAAKLVVINSVLVASITHVLAVFKIPKSICERIDQLCLQFWWRSSADSRGISMLPASILHLPKGMGGLGIRSIQDFNQALLAKNAWRIVHNPQLLLSRLFRVRYPNLSLAGSRASGSRPSWGFRSLAVGFQVLDQGIAWKPGAGNHIRITQDTWVPGNLVRFKASVIESVKPTHVSSLLDPRSYAWNVELVHQLFDDHTASQILALERPSVQKDDFVYWKFSYDGKFTVRSAYAMLMGQNHNVASQTTIPSASWWKHFWGLKIMHKLKVFFWKLLRHSLSLASILQMGGMPIDPACSFCHQFPETFEHLFRDCPLITQFWAASSSLQVLLPNPSGSLENWCMGFMANCSSSRFHQALLDKFISLLWSVWILRNNIRFRNAVWDPGALSALLVSWTVRCSEVRAVSPPSSNQSRTLCPIPLDHPGLSRPVMDFSVICLICDGAWNSTTNGVRLDSSRSYNSVPFWGGGGQACVLASTLQAELLACLWGLRMAINRGFTKVLLFSNCAVLIDLVTSSQPGPVSITWALQDLRLRLRSLEMFSALKDHLGHFPRSRCSEVRSTAVQEVPRWCIGGGVGVRRRFPGVYTGCFGAISRGFSGAVWVRFAGWFRRCFAGYFRVFFRVFCRVFQPVFGGLVYVNSQATIWFGGVSKEVLLRGWCTLFGRVLAGCRRFVGGLFDAGRLFGGLLWPAVCVAVCVAFVWLSGARCWLAVCVAFVWLSVAGYVVVLCGCLCCCLCGCRWLATWLVYDIR